MRNRRFDDKTSERILLALLPCGLEKQQAQQPHSLRSRIGREDGEIIGKAKKSQESQKNEIRDTLGTPYPPTQEWS
jgi:hypothetical protein